jgi:REP-associated tyrosine transposase
MPNQVMRQVELKFSTWGGKRKGAGRKRVGEKRVTHRTRPALAHRFPVHVTWKMNKRVWNLRAGRTFRVIKRAFLEGSNDGFQVVHYSVMGNHIHMLVEAQDEVRLSRGMQGLGVRIARALNKVMAERGRCLADRFHSRILRTPTEVKKVREYLLTNARKHYGETFLDVYSSQTALHRPRTFLVRQVC